MTTKKDYSLYRSDLFRHLDGIVTAPAAYALHSKGVTAHILEHQNCSLSELTDTFGANDGYLNVALRMLCSQGWLSQQIANDGSDIRFDTTPSSAKAFTLFSLYDDVVKLQKFSEQFHTRKFEAEPFQMLEGIFRQFKNNYGLSTSEDELTKY